MRDQLLQQAHGAVKEALAAGADDAVASVSWGRSLEFKWREGKVEKVQEDTSRGLSVALYVDGRFSAHSTNDLDPRRLTTFVADAVELTRALEPDEYRKITPPKLYEGRADIDLDLVDSSLADLSREQRLDWCRQMEAASLDHKDVVSSTTGVGDSYSIVAACSSNGFEGCREGTSIAYGSEVTLAEGENRRPEAWWWVGANHLEGLPEPTAVGREALRRGLARLGSTRGPSKRTVMVVDHEIGSSLLGRLLSSLSAGSIQQKRSFLADKMGEKIASSCLSVTDQPHLPRRGGSRVYDSEGIATSPMSIIEDGVLQSFFVDTYYGRKLGLAPTSGSASNLVLSLGEHNCEELLSEVGEGIYVTSWLGGNANGTTGDFSFGVRGHLIEGGKLAAPVEEMNVSGNFLELFSQLSMVGNDPVPWSSFRVPTLVFDGVQFSGS
jgi:PmbA protein